MASVNPLQAEKYSARDIEQLRTLVPLHTLSDELFAELLDDLVVQSFNKGTVLFREGDTDYIGYYLLKGRLSLLKDGKTVDSLQAGTEPARFPVAHMLPRQMGARAATRVRVARLDSRRVSELLSRAERTDYRVDELEEADASDWMSLLLQSRVLQQLPASNIQRIMMSVEQVDVRAGERIIRQGDPGDYFYMLIQGQAVVQREEDDGKRVELARLGPGDAFGEEALLSDSPRNSSVTMLGDGQVLRLSKEHFLELIQSPLARHIDYAEAERRIGEGAIWVDLRPPEEHERDHLPDSINLPMETLRYQLDSLDPERHYVLYSNSGGRSAVAAFLMTEQGFDVTVLDGGLDALRDGEAQETVKRHPAVETLSPDERLRELEDQAAALRQRLRATQAELRRMEQQKHDSLRALRGTIENIQEKLRVKEEERRRLQQERDRAHAEAEALSGRITALEQERAALSERVDADAAHRERLERRLAHLESELVGAREQAESAGDAMAGLEARIQDLREERDRERERRLAETGELKERLTVLQDELESLRQEAETRGQREDTRKELERLLAESREEQARLAERLVEIEAALEEAGQARERLEVDLAEQEREGRELREARTALQADLEEQRQARETAEQALAEANALREELEARLNAEVQARQAAERARDDLRSEAERREAALREAQEAARQAAARAEAVEARLADAQVAEVDGEALAAVEERAARLQADLDASEQARAALREELEAASRWRTEAQDLGARLAELEARLASAEATEARAEEAGAELERLRQSLREREQALSAAEEELARLRESLAEAERRQEALDRRREGEDSLASELAAARQAAEAFEQHRQSLIEQLAERENEVAELRGVLEAYVEQITQIQNGDDSDRLQALQREMELLREESGKEIAALRRELDEARQALQAARGETTASGLHDAAELEAMRQALHDTRRALAERQQAIEKAEENRQALEDALEDANARIDELRREMDRLAVEAEEAGFRAEEADKARAQLQQEILRFQEELEVAKVSDLRDERVRGGRVPLELEAVWNGSWLSRLISIALGAGLAVAGLEAVSFLSGRGELFTSLFRF